MTDHYTPKPPAEKAYLVGVSLRGSQPLFTVEDSLSELHRLAHTAGLVIVGQATQTLNKIDPATFIRSGKVEEIKIDLEANEAKVVIFDDELSPRHQR